MYMPRLSPSLLLQLLVIPISFARGATAGCAAVSGPGAVVLDVRNQDEYDAGHLACAQLTPNPTLSLAVAAEKIGSDKTKSVAVYCRSGARAGQAKTKLEGWGYTNVVNAGGYDALVAAGCGDCGSGSSTGSASGATSAGSASGSVSGAVPRSGGGGWLPKGIGIALGSLGMAAIYL
mmetsp:Transcript_21555/g.54378  ORF Transcript_21555/g.54378 Transcript_21555/m.54378 type:complete len:177 (-) Transcript_21555:399-929(-)|eukprot:CAMPEP_0178999892 /NCGR_PEP_ID=MMETSP0795-20121207/10352_1 /TAXON_ID=88552 /ORGANISM="Amoebophrya sp., Strain Ameob2" /LENGTH=176 /DNA_ID=CAMNT_0020692795 /DNA_START=207 /DNA_END=737 /DNA_ORIENTATION=+